MEATLQRELIEHYTRAYNDFDVDGMIKHLNENIRFESFSNGKVELRIEGIEAFKKQAESAKAYFSERKQTIRSWAFTDQKVRIEIDYRATLAIDFSNALKSGDLFQLKGESIFYFENNQITHIIDKS